jgi:phosphatidylserine decarboxylase
MNQYKWADPPSRTAFPIARPGYPFIGAGAFATAVFALAGLSGLSVAGLLITGFICWFFRDPDRLIPDESNAVVSPADGKIVIAQVVENSPMGKGKCLKISVFMSVLNVHVNRIPFAGKITKILYYPGKFFSANLDKASSENEHNAVFLHTESGKDICFVQIAGLVARRIICLVHEGDQLERGQRFGMICFGSRLDVYLPADTTLNVSVGDRVAAGASILAHLKS